MLKYIRTPSSGDPVSNPYRQTILAAILAHSAVAINQFQPQEIKELAPGIIGVEDSDGEYCLFFDRDQIKLDTNILEDMLEGIDSIGMIFDVMAKNLGQILYTAKRALARQDSQPIDWHKPPIPLEL